MTNFRLNWQFRFFFFFLMKFSRKIICNKANEEDHWFLHIRISLGTKFQLKLTISNFWNKFAQREYFQSKVENLNTTIEFWIFELDYIANFILAIFIFRTKFPQKGYFWQKKWASSMNSVDLNYPTIIHNIFGTKCSFHVNWRTMGKVQFLIFRRF